MELSEKGLAFIASREAAVCTAYRDTTMLAIGFGINRPDLKEGDTITIEQACADLVKSARGFLVSLSRILSGVELKQQHVDALLSSGYNTGMGALSRNSALVSAVKAFARDHGNKRLRDQAGYQIIRANYSEANGPFNLSRRCREALVFTAGDYGDLTRLTMWGPGKNPHKDAPETVPMPTFLKG